MLQHIESHSKRVVQQVKRREEHLLKKLIIPVIAVRHICGHKSQLVLQTLYAVAVAPHNLPYIGILFMRHNAGACGKLIGKLYECKVVAHIHTAVCSKFVKGVGHLSHCGCNKALALSATHLCSYGVVV